MGRPPGHRRGRRPKIFMFMCFFLGTRWPSGPETLKKSEKSLSGPPAPGPSRVWKKSRKSLFGTFSGLFPDSRDFFQTFSRLSGAPGRDFFQTFSGFRARRARETPVNGQRVPKPFSFLIVSILSQDFGLRLKSQD